MPVNSLECLPENELFRRHARCRELLSHHAPEAGGLLVSSPLSIYYLTGTLATGVFWLPLEGTPCLCIRKGLLRARAESPLERTGGVVAPFRSFKDLEPICGAFPAVMAVDMDGFSWSQGELLRSRLTGVKSFVPGDTVLNRARMVKSEWELAKMRLAGARHAHCLLELAPKHIRSGMTEREIARILLNLFLENGHSGLIRLTGGKDTFFGHVSAGNSGLYPTGFDGPLGTRGIHPSTPWFGDAGSVWKDLLTLDVGFVVEGYNTDKTVTCWAGPVPDAVKRAHESCEVILAHTAEAMRPGVLFSELWQNAREMADAAGYADTFMGVGPERVRFLGHGIGLCVDEFPAMADKFDESLVPGMTVAVEPKIALPGLGMVGVEETYEITEKGAVCLTGKTGLLIFP